MNYIKLAIVLVIAYTQWRLISHWYPCNDERRIALFVGTCILLAGWIVGG